MGKYFYVTLAGPAVSSPEDYRGIVIEDVDRDYLEVTRFQGASFLDDYTAYHAWGDEQVRRDPGVEIWESDTLQALYDYYTKPR